MTKDFRAQFLIWIGVIGVAISLSTLSSNLAQFGYFLEYSKLMRYLFWWFDHAARVFWSRLLAFTSMDFGGGLPNFLTIQLFLLSIYAGVYLLSGSRRTLGWRKILAAAIIPALATIVLVYILDKTIPVPPPIGKYYENVRGAFFMAFMASLIVLFLMDGSVWIRIFYSLAMLVFFFTSFSLLFFWGSSYVGRWREDGVIWCIERIIFPDTILSSFLWFPFVALNPSEVARRFGFIFSVMLIILCASEMSKIMGPWQDTLQVPAKERPSRVRGGDLGGIGPDQ